MLMNIDQLKVVIHSISKLLDDPQPGLFTWQQALFNHLSALQWTEVSITYRDFQEEVSVVNGNITLDDNIARQISNTFALRKDSDDISSVDWRYPVGQ